MQSCQFFTFQRAILVHLWTNFCQHGSFSFKVWVTRKYFFRAETFGLGSSEGSLKIFKLNSLRILCLNPSIFMKKLNYLDIIRWQGRKEGIWGGGETGQVVFVYKKFKICTIPSYIYKHSLSWISITLGTEREVHFSHSWTKCIYDVIILSDKWTHFIHTCIIVIFKMSRPRLNIPLSHRYLPTFG